MLESIGFWELVSFCFWKFIPATFIASLTWSIVIAIVIAFGYLAITLIANR